MRHRREDRLVSRETSAESRDEVKRDRGPFDSSLEGISFLIRSTT